MATRSGHISLCLLQRPTFPRRMIDVFGEDRGGTCALLLLQSRLEGRRLSIHTLIMSQLPDISETITVGGLYPKPSQASWARFSASSSRVYRRFHKKSSTRPTFNQIREPLMPNPVFSSSFSSSSSGAGVAKAKSSDSDQISPKPAWRDRERKRESKKRVCQSPSSQIQKILPRKKEECRGWERRRGIQRNFRGYFFPLYFFSPLLDINI